MLCFSGLQRENKWKEILAGNWLAYRLVVLGLRLARGDSFLPTSRRCHPPPREPRPERPETSPRLPWFANPATRHQGNRCRFACLNVPVGLQASKHACRQRTNNPLRAILTCVTRLKRRTSCPSGSGGAGVRHVARFFPIIHSTPPAIFFAISPLASPHLT